MSKLEDLVVSVETASMLIEAGIEVDSVCWWHECYQSANQQSVWAIDNAHYTHLQNKAFCDEVLQSIPAPTLEELLPLLPKTIDLVDTTGYKHRDMRYSLYPAMNNNVYYLSYLISEKYAKNEKACEAVADMLIKLKMEGVS